MVIADGTHSNVNHLRQRIYFTITWSPHKYIEHSMITAELSEQCFLKETGIMNILTLFSSEGAYLVYLLNYGFILSAITSYCMTE